MTRFQVPLFISLSVAALTGACGHGAGEPAEPPPAVAPPSPPAPEATPSAPEATPPAPSAAAPEAPPVASAVPIASAAPEPAASAAPPGKAGKSKAPAPPVASASPPPAGDAPASDACTTKNFHYSQIGAACKSGGRKAAKEVMKGAVKKAKAAGTDLKCTSCHTDMGSFGLRGNAVSDLKQWL